MIVLESLKCTGLFGQGCEPRMVGRSFNRLSVLRQSNDVNCEEARRGRTFSQRERLRLPGLEPFLGFVSLRFNWDIIRADPRSIALVIFWTMTTTIIGLTTAIVIDPT
jgi:hypothetical protein